MSPSNGDGKYSFSSTGAARLLKKVAHAVAVWVNRWELLGRVRLTAAATWWSAREILRRHPYAGGGRGGHVLVPRRARGPTPLVGGWGIQS